MSTGSPRLLFIAFVFAGGLATAVQPSVNAALARRGGLVAAVWVSFTVGSLIMLVPFLLSGGFSGQWARETRWWEWTGGLYGVFLVLALTFGVPRAGTGAVMAIYISGLLLAGLLVDHFGWLGNPQVSLNPSRVLGTAMLLAGCYLVLKR